MKYKLTVVKSLVFLMSGSAFAQNPDSHPYSFGHSGCSLAGSYTQDALRQTNLMRSAIEGLKDAPECKAIYEAASKHFAAGLGEPVKYAEEQKKESATEKYGKLTAEVHAARKYLAEFGGSQKNPFASGDDSAKMKDLVLGALTKKTFEQAKTIAEAKSEFSASEPDKPGPDTASRRAQRGVQAMANSLAAIMPAIAKNQQCIVGQGAAGLAMLSASIQALGTVASNDGAGMSTSISTALTALGEMLRNKPFNLALKKINKTEFLVSASCLWETTLVNYCQILDDQKVLFKEIERLNTPPPKAVSDKLNPLSGLYILNRDVENLTDWLQLVRSAAPPQTSQDADRNTSFYQSPVTVIAEANKMLANLEFSIRSLRSVEKSAQKAPIVTTIQKIASNIRGINAAGQDTNTFVSIPDDMVELALVGITERPVSMQGGDKGSANKQSGGDYLNNHPDVAYLFKDPDLLLKKIRTNMNAIIRDAKLRASKNFLERVTTSFRVTMAQAAISITVSQKASLVNIQNYLYNLYYLYEKDSDSEQAMGLIVDTYLRISAVLKAFDKIGFHVGKAAGRAIKNPTAAELKQFLKDDALYLELVNIVYDNFNVMWQNDTFFLQIMPKLVAYDFDRRVRTSGGLATYENDIIVALGDDLLGRMQRLTGKEPTLMRGDMANALVTAQQNISTIEQFFAPLLFPYLDELSLVANGIVPTVDMLNDLGYERAFYDYKGTPLKTNEQRTSRPGGALTWLKVNMPWAGIINMNPDRYPMLNYGEYTPYRNDETNSAGALLDRLCMQTLGMGDPGMFKIYCKGRVLLGELEPTRKRLNPDAPPLKIDYDELANNYWLQPGVQAGRNSDYMKATGKARDAANCAINRFRVKNQGYHVTMQTQREMEKEKQSGLSHQNLRDIYNINAINAPQARNPSSVTSVQTTTAGAKEGMIKNNSSYKLQNSNKPLPQKLFPLT